MELCVIEGDGIGREVIPAAVQVLRQVVPDIQVYHAPAGWEYFQQYGTSLPESTIELAQRCGAVLFGAVSSPSYPVEGYFTPIVRLRRTLNTYANLRPTRYLPVSTAREGIDLMIVRENTEDLYVIHEQTVDEGRTGLAEKVITRAASERIARLAYTLAVNDNHEKVTVVHKANVLPQSDGLFRRTTLEIAMSFPDIRTDELLVDTAAYWMVKEPTRFDVILTSNMYGDILSDMAAAWGGGLGLAPSLNLGDGIAIAEPVHGSAPDIAGQGVANPTAAILSAALLLRHHWHLPESADRIDAAVYATLAEGDHTSDIYIEGAISTQEFTDHVCAHL